MRLPAETAFLPSFVTLSTAKGLTPLNEGGYKGGVRIWKIGQCINSDILENKRADFGKQIVSQLAKQLATKYGRSFELRNVRRMMQFAEQFQDFTIVSTLSTQLSWSHFVEVLPLKNEQARLYYAQDAAARCTILDGTAAESGI